MEPLLTTTEALEIVNKIKDRAEITDREHSKLTAYILSFVYFEELWCEQECDICNDLFNDRCSNKCLWCLARCAELEVEEYEIDLD